MSPDSDCYRTAFRRQRIEANQKYGDHYCSHLFFAFSVKKHSVRQNIQPAARSLPFPFFSTQFVLLLINPIVRFSWVSTLRGLCSKSPVSKYSASSSVRTHNKVSSCDD